MKLAVAVVAALSSAKVAHGFVVPGARVVSSSSSSTRCSSSSSGVSMTAEHDGAMPVSAPMDRKQMLQSAALAFGVAVVGGNPSQSVAAAVDFGKVSKNGNY